VRRAWPALLLVSAILGACGERRTPPPSLTTPMGFAAGRQTLSYPAAGVTMALPRGWSAIAGRAPMVVTASGGPATVTVWRYPRTEALPRTRASLRHALSALLGAVRSRDASFRLESARVLRLVGRPAVQVVGLETVDGQPRRVRSEHIYAHGAETVIDAFAPEAQFRAVNAGVFRPLLRSLRIGPPR
jgi:hypothetical protein